MDTGTRSIRASLLGVGVAAFAPGGAVPATATPPADIKAYCATKWVEYQMQAFCIDQETAAQRRLAAGVADQAIWSRCYYKWDSWQMAAFCVAEEEKAKAKIQGRSPAGALSVQPPALPAPAAPTPAPRQGSTRHPCILYADLLYYDRDGKLSANGFRDSFAKIGDWARAYGDPRFTEASLELLKAGTLNQDYGERFSGPERDIAQLRPRLKRPMARMTELCAPEPAFLEAQRDRGGGAPITPQDAERQLKGVLEREGATDAKCTKKQFGTGWVTVCE
jgi:hypothetical protein